MDRTNKLILLQTALKRTTNDALTTSTAVDITLESNTSIIEIVALDAGIYLKKGITASSTSYDLYVPEGQMRHFYLPKRTANDALKISVIADGATAKFRLIQK